MGSCLPKLSLLGCSPQLTWFRTMDSSLPCMHFTTISVSFWCKAFCCCLFAVYQEAKRSVCNTLLSLLCFPPCSNKLDKQTSGSPGVASWGFSEGLCLCSGAACHANKRIYFTTFICQSLNVLTNRMNTRATNKIRKLILIFSCWQLCCALPPRLGNW